MTINQASANLLLNLILQAQAWPSMAINATSSPYTQFWLALHTADPGPTGVQTTNEIFYTGYGRSLVPRSSAGWNAAAGGIATLAANVTFPTVISGNAVATYISIGTAQTGGGSIIFSGQLATAIACGPNVIPTVLAGSPVTVT